MKAELSKYPIDPRLIEDLNIFMIVHQFESIEVLIKKTDEELNQMDGFSTHLLMEIQKLRKIFNRPRP
jgi:DNA integrity scanning protein DisA with diadenylate cyclase activity